MTNSDPHNIIEARPNPKLKVPRTRQRRFFSYVVIGYIKYFAPGLLTQLFPEGAGVASIGLAVFLLLVFLPAQSERKVVIKAGNDWSWWKLIIGEIFGPLIVSGLIVTFLIEATALVG